LGSESISQERKERWESRFVDFDSLPEVSRGKDRFFAKEILDFFGIKKTGIVGENFDQNLIDKKKEENLTLSEKVFGINEILESLSKKIRILNSNTEDAGEVLSQEIEIEILKMEKSLSFESSQVSQTVFEKNKLVNELESYKREESFAVAFFGHDSLKNFSENELRNQSETLNILEKIVRVRILLENSPQGNSEEILEEYNSLVERQEFIFGQIADLEKTKDDLSKLIIDISNQIEEKFRFGVEKINKEFSTFFSTLFSGGRAEINLVEIPIKKEDEDEVQEFELGIDMKVNLPNKKISGLSMLSGGERSLTSIALLFAMSSITPPPFIILDETDAALDEANSKRYGDMIEKLAEHSQLILITHNRETMSRAGLLYGVTMNQSGESKLLSVSLEEGEKYAK
jgi:chromosome segregation protein